MGISAARMSCIRERRSGDGEIVTETDRVEVQPSERRRMVFRSARRTFFIFVNDITYINAEGKYSRVHTAAPKSLLVREIIGSIEPRLPRHFFRVHRSTIVNIDRIVEIRSTQRRVLIVLDDGTQLPLAPNRREELERILSA
jgi:two-component system LytT family response regulator